MKQRGIALVTVMMVVAIVAILAADMGKRLQLQVSREMNLINNQQAQWYAFGGEAFTMRLISQSLAQDDDTVHLGQMWAAEEQTFPVPGGSIGGKVVDLQSCFNVNSLANYEEGNSEAAKKARAPFQRMLEAMELDDISDFEIEAMAESLQDWVDSDDFPLNNGAEDGTYMGKAYPYATANSPMVSIASLRLIENFSANVVQQIAPYVCAVPEQTELKINVNTVDTEQAEILAGVIEGLSISDAREVLSSRPDDGFEDMDEFWQTAVLATISDSVKDDAADLLSVDSKWFAAELETRFNGSRFVLRSVFNVTDNNEVLVVSRRIGDML